VLLFVLGVSARPPGAIRIPLDPRHLGSQLVGLGLLLVGLMLLR